LYGERQLGKLGFGFSKLGNTEIKGRSPSLENKLHKKVAQLKMSLKSCAKSHCRAKKQSMVRFSK